jgi:Flp pilus assembly pilin Flp
MVKRNRKGQSTLEYILLVTAVLVVLISLLGSGGFFQTALNGTLTQPMTQMNSISNRLGATQ